MIISTKGKYALRLMLELANYYQGDPVRIKDIAQRQNISEKYLEQIVSYLNKAGLVKSIRGPRGGYILSRAPEEYTVRVVLQTVDGDLSVVDMSGTDSDAGENRQIKTCNILWKKLDDALGDIFDNVTLSDLKDWQDENESLTESCWI